MKITVNNRAENLITFLMIGLMGMLIVNKIIFTHIHQLDDGTIVKHAHPYNKIDDSEPLKTHHHSNAELLFFQNLNILFLVVFIAQQMFFLAKRERISFDLIQEHRLAYINFRIGRSPPLL